jgi:very-short-patch-repair endonuclease
VTTIARTLLDLAATLSEAQLTAACDEVERQRQIDWADVLVLLERHRRHRGRRRLQRVLALAGIETRQSKSLLEDAFVAICVEHGLPAPAQNVDLLGHWVDAFWEDRRLVVEVDHDEWHRTRFAREADKRRDLELTLAGYRVVRVTEGRIQHDAAAVGDQIRALYHAPVHELGRLAMPTAR